MTSGTYTSGVSYALVTVYYRKRRWWRRVWEALRDLSHNRRDTATVREDERE